MCAEQAAAFDAIVASIDAGEPGFFFIDGPRGSGETYLCEASLHYDRGTGRRNARVGEDRGRDIGEWRSRVGEQRDCGTRNRS